MFLFRFVAVLAVCGGSLAFGCALPAPADEAPPRKEPGKLQVEIAGGTVTVNGTKLSLPIERKDLIRLLGKPSREMELANTILTWDDLGIHAYQVLNTEKVRAIQVTLDPETYRFSPKKVFSGSLKVEGAVVTAESTIKDINRAMKQGTFRKEEGLGSWKVQYKDCVLYLNQADTKTKTEKANFSSLQLDQKESK
jgi:hypothetical protein